MKNDKLLTGIFLFLAAAFLALGARCFYLQYLKSDYFRGAYLRQRLKWTEEQPQRGAILDCFGRVLAASNKYQTIFVEPRAVKDAEETAAGLSPIVKMDAMKIYNIIKDSKNPGFIKIKTDATEKECQEAVKVDGAGVQTSWRRYWPMGRLACHVVGFTGVDNTGLEGIELEYDKQLRGDAGRNVFFADVLRRPISLKEQTADLSDGCGVILTIEASIQQFARGELTEVVSEFQAESGSAIVADPRSGEILAMVTIPDFDPNNIRSSDKDNLRNRAITDQFEPGSVIKPFVVAVGIDSGAIDREEKIFCENGEYHGKGFGRITEYSNHRYGNLSIKEILVESSNIGMAKVGQRIGAERLYNGLRLLGFGRKTGMDLPGEAEGFMRPADKWTGYSVTRIPFGQEVSVTTIQILRAFCVIANGGHFVQPHLVKAIVDNNGNIVKVNRPVPPYGTIVNPETAAWLVKEPLTAVVNEGTGKRAKLKKWQVFGKTGTAQLALKEGGGYSETDYVATFIGGAPAEAPEIVVMMSVIKPNIKLGKGYTGGAVAAPAVGRIIEQTLNYLESRGR